VTLLLLLLLPALLLLPLLNLLLHAQMGRDVFNEKPSTEELLAADAAGVGASSLPRGAVLHTTKVRHDHTLTF
jgi:hypothetical protein